MKESCDYDMIIFPVFYIKVGSNNSHCQIFEFVSRANC